MIIEEGKPVVGSTAMRPRWGVVVVAAVAMLAVAIGGVAGAFLVGGRAGAGAGSAASYVSADAAMYIELRLDLPGDQRALARQVLDRFEPIDTDTLLGAKLADWLDQKLASPDPRVVYSTEIAPWFTGELALAMNSYPSGLDSTSMTVPDMVAMLGVRDTAAARAFADRMRGEAQDKGATFTSEAHRGVTIWSLVSGPSALGAGSMSTMAPGFAYAVGSDQLLFGPSTASVERALDVHAGTAASLAQREELRRLAARLPADRVGLVSFDYASMLKQLRADLLKANPQMGGALDELMAHGPTFGVAAARFEADRLTFEGVADAPSGAAVEPNGDRNVARWVPGDAIMVSDTPKLGQGLANAIGTLKSGISTQGNATDSLDQVEAALGGDLDSFVSWIGDGTFVAGWDGEQPYGGMILVPADATAARQRLARLDALARLAIGQPGSAFSVSDATVGGVKVTTLRYKQPTALDSVGLSGVAVQYAVTDEHVIIGLGDRFVGRVLGLQESQSLAASTRYRSAIASVGGSSNLGSSYLDLAALRSAVEKALPADARAEYDKVASPYLEPFDYLVSATRLDGSVVDVKAALVVK